MTATNLPTGTTTPRGDLVLTRIHSLPCHYSFAPTHPQGFQPVLLPWLQPQTLFQSSMGTKADTVTWIPIAGIVILH